MPTAKPGTPAPKAIEPHGAPLKIIPQFWITTHVVKRVAHGANEKAAEPREAWVITEYNEQEAAASHS